MANNPYVNKVELADGTTVMDITDTTAEAGDVIQGETFYTASGARSTGTLGVFQPATASSPGSAGLVPAPTYAQRGYFLRGDGNWSHTNAFSYWFELTIQSSEWESGQDWPSYGASPPCGETSPTCDLVEKTVTMADPELAIIITDYDQDEFSAPVWVYIDNGVIQIATRDGCKPTSTVKINGLIIA